LLVLLKIFLTDPPRIPIEGQMSILVREGQSFEENITIYANPRVNAYAWRKDGFTIDRSIGTIFVRQSVIGGFFAIFLNYKDILFKISNGDSWSAEYFGIFSSIFCSLFLFSSVLLPKDNSLLSYLIEFQSTMRKIKMRRRKIPSPFFSSKERKEYLIFIF